MDPESLDVNKLEFGALFGDSSKVTPLTNAEVVDILRAKKNEVQAEGKEPLEALENTLQYVERAALGMNSDVARELRSFISEKERFASNLRRKLHPFEIVALINLAPEDYDQATALIPSLLFFDNPDEKEFIEDIVTQIRDKTQF